MLASQKETSVSMEEQVHTLEMDLLASNSAWSLYKKKMMF